jgi:hypothetical protein
MERFHSIVGQEDVMAELVKAATNEFGSIAIVFGN